MKRMLGIGVLLVVILLVILLVISSFPSKPKTTEHLTIALLDQPYYALIYIAEEEGYFEDEGITVSYKKYKKGKDALSAALAGKADIATVGDAPLVRRIYEGSDLLVITTLYTSTENTALVARKDLGIERAEDLIGKRIGVVRGTTAEFFLFSFLTNEGLSSDDVIVVDLYEKQDLEKVLEGGEVDAVVALNPYLYQIKKAFPKESLTIFTSDLYTNSSVLAGSRNTVLKRKEALLRMLRGLVKAEQLIKTNKQKAIEAVATALPKMKKNTIKNTWNDFKPDLMLNNVLLVVLEREAEWFKENDVYKGKIPDFRKAMYTDYLKEVDPEAVTIY